MASIGQRRQQNTVLRESASRHFKAVPPLIIGSYVGKGGSLLSSQLDVRLTGKSPGDIHLPCP